MIGDWVYDTILQGYTKVEALTLSGIRGTINNAIWNEKSFEPIPITPEILEMNFQESLPGINLMYHLKGPYCVMNEDGQWVFGLVKDDGENSARYPLVKISFVHELQNALRICGITKEIQI